MEHSPDDGAVPVIFGHEEADRAIGEWLWANHLELGDDPEPLETGGSGGRLVSVFVRELDDRRTGGVRIVKLVAPSEDAAAEPHNHGLALRSRVRDNEDFIGRHLVELADKPWRLGDSWLMFQKPAGDGKQITGTLAGLGRTRRLPELAAEIVKGVLGGWNPQDPEFDKGSAAAFVARLLGARLNARAPLRAWVRGHFDAAPEERPWFRLADREDPLPNPLFLAEGSGLSTCQVRFAAYGRAHGDLHPGNIMVPVRESASPEDFWLIDLSRFRERAPLVRDPVHLLLCLVADAYLPQLSDEARQELLGALLSPDPGCEGPLIPQGLAALVTKVRTELIDWGAARNITAGWHPQWFLALQACALMFTARHRYTCRDRWWFYLLAAEACGAYLDGMGVQRPRSAPLLHSPAVMPSPAPHGAPAVVTAPRGTPPARVAPPRTGARETDDRPVTELLRQIWETFERPLRHLNVMRVEDLQPAEAEFLRLRAIDFRLSLGNPRRGTDRGVGESDARRLGRVLELLGEVADRALALWQTLRSPRPPEPPGHPGPAVLKDLVSALDALLQAVAEATHAPAV